MLTSWSDCSATCSSGVQTKSRQCSNPSLAGPNTKDCSHLVQMKKRKFATRNLALVIFHSTVTFTTKTL